MAFAITPKRTVHEIFGCHDKTPTPYHHTQGKETNFNKDGFHCACENQAFQNTFIAGIVPQVFTSLQFVAIEKPTALNTPLFGSDIRIAYLRGPPSLI